MTFKRRRTWRSWYDIGPTKVALMPCIFIVFLWFVLPAPQLQETGFMDAEMRKVAIDALQETEHDQARIRYRSRMRRLKELQRLQNGESSVLRPSVLVLTATRPSACETSAGTYISLLSIKNKQEYATKQGYDFYVSTEQTSASLTGAWNKVALVERLLNTTQYEWILWMDLDALVMNPNFDIPWNRYDGRDLIMWGQAKELFEVGDAHMGLNTGVFMVRNTPWSRNLFSKIGYYGQGNGKTFEEEMKNTLGKYEWALFDQNGFAYVLKTWHPKVNEIKVYLENKYYLNGYWKDLPMSKMEEVNPFVKHFMGCQFCSGINSKESEECEKDFHASWQYSNVRMKHALFEEPNNTQ